MRVICVVDDAVQRSSLFWGERGVAFLIETEGSRVLFDTGQSGTVLLRNLKLLREELTNPNHCTGEEAFVALAQILGPSVVRPCPAGTVLEF